MQSLKESSKTFIIERPVKQQVICYHCGTPCVTSAVAIDDKVFCCEGCKLVYEILDGNGLCDYYKFQDHPGLTQIKAKRFDKYDYLDNKDIAAKLIKFTDGNYTIVNFYIPGVHCSSCMWLLEHLNKLDAGIAESRLNFTTKEVTIHFYTEKTSLRHIVELLTTVGYEPYISLDDLGKKDIKDFNRQRIYKLGVAGFCFGNIMMMSFPEYFSINTGIEGKYVSLFRVLNLLLALPVFFFSASEFFVTAWKGLKQKVLNIDAPIALAIIITFGRSLYEIITRTGAGYLDSMSGIVFFMLVGRVLQERTYKSISFHRDYKSYFPVAVTVLTGKGTESKTLQDLKEKDVVALHNDEIIPADAVVLDGKARIDYSFVTGETQPVEVAIGKTVYAGGRQTGEKVIIQLVKPVAGSYLTSLWDHFAFKKNKIQDNKEKSVVHILSKYFTAVLLSLATLTAIYWAVKDPSKIISSVSAMLIVACPCALLLSATFTNGILLRIFSANGLFLRNASVIEQMGKIDQIVFDKTGTLTENNKNIECSGATLTDQEKDWVYSVAISSQHPYSRALVQFLGKRKIENVSFWKERRGKGLEAVVTGNEVMIGSANFVGVKEAAENKAAMYVYINGRVTAFYLIPGFRDGAVDAIPVLAKQYGLSLLSGDNDRQKKQMANLFNENTSLLFDQQPVDKLNYVAKLQNEHHHVMMVGDGLNDAGALQQSNVGITLSDDINNFTPSCDAILDAKRLSFFPQLLKLSRSAQLVVNISFAVSVIYNIVGLYFAMQGLMRPVIAAILMPCSTLSIVLLTSGVSSIISKRLGLSLS